jgi:hypothetical protein
MKKSSMERMAYEENSKALAVSDFYVSTGEVVNSPKQKSSTRLVFILIGHRQSKAQYSEIHSIMLPWPLIRRRRRRKRRGQG